MTLRSSGPHRLHLPSPRGLSRFVMPARDPPGPTRPDPASVTGRAEPCGISLHVDPDGLARRYRDSFAIQGVVHSRGQKSTPGIPSSMPVAAGTRSVTAVDSSRSCPQGCAQVGEISWRPGHDRSRIGGPTRGRCPFPEAASMPLDSALTCVYGCGHPVLLARRRPNRGRGGARHRDGLGMEQGDAGDSRWTATGRGAQPSRCPRVDTGDALTTHSRPTGPFGR
jgi:hypothetical protein